MDYKTVPLDCESIPTVYELRAKNDLVNFRQTWL